LEDDGRLLKICRPYLGVSSLLAQDENMSHACETVSVTSTFTYHSRQGLLVVLFRWGTKL